MRYEFKKYIQRFLELGLSERETKVYIELLSKKSFTSSELQKSAGIPRTKIYEVLLKLINRGICVERQVGKTRYYEALEPKRALNKILDDYKNNFQVEFEKKKNLAENLSEVFNPVFEKNKDIDSPLEIVEVIKDKVKAQERILHAFRNSKSEVLSLVKGPYVCDTAARINAQVREERKLLKRGVAYRKIYESGELNEHELLIDQFKPLAKYGEQLKVIKSIPIKMVIYDQEMVIFPLQDVLKDPDELTIILVQHKQMVSACRMLFDSLWRIAKPLK